MTLTRRKTLGLALASVSVLAFPTMSSASAARGLEIATERVRRDRGWRDTVAEVEMVLTNKRGQSAKRAMRVKTLEVAGDGDKSITIFDLPRDVKGTAFLSHSHAVAPDDQWLFLPARSRVKRIASRNKSGPFMGSEFAFEDLGSFELKKFTYEYLGDEKLGKTKCHVVAQVPVDKHSGYRLLKAWVDTAHYRPIKIEYYDRKKSLLKTLNFTGYKKYKGKFWRAGKAVMVNHQTGKSTTMQVKSMKFGVGLSAQEFTQASLKQAR